MRTPRNRLMLVAVVASVTLLGAACGSSSKTSSNASDTTSSTAAAAQATPASTAPQGPGCAAVPTTGAGSFSGMSAVPVATAASNNPALTTLVSAVKQAGLVDTLNTGGPFTVFAPVNSAFDAIPKDQLSQVMANKDLLTKILTYHVVPKRVEMGNLAGTYTTVNGAQLKVEGTGPGFEIGGMQAKVVCAGIQTANATVYLIDHVLMPPANS